MSEIIVPSTESCGKQNFEIIYEYDVENPTIDTCARACAYPPNYCHYELHTLVTLLRTTGLLGEDETVIPFSHVINGCVVPYPNNLGSIFLQIFDKAGVAIDENIYVFEMFNLARVKVTPL